MPTHSRASSKQHGALRRRERRRADAFGRDHLAVSARAEHEVANLNAENRLLLLLGIERVDERERFVVFVAQRTHRPAVDL